MTCRGAQASPGEAYYGVAAGRWRDADILMDEVSCDGSEPSLQRCRYIHDHDCRVSEAASVACQTNAGKAACTRAYARVFRPPPQATCVRRRGHVLTQQSAGQYKTQGLRKRNVEKSTQV